MNTAFPTPTLKHGRDGLQLEDVPLATLAAQFGTPTFVYSHAALREAYEAWRGALTGRNALVCYAVKANSNLGVLSAFARLGAGFDIVSGGELARVVAAGGEPGKVVFSGVGKSAAEMRLALAAGIRCFNVESAAELERLNAVAGEFAAEREPVDTVAGNSAAEGERPGDLAGASATAREPLDAVAGKVDQRAPIALRVNPDVDPKTHPYISTGLRNNKFGVAFDDALALYRRAACLPHVRITGIACHIGSQLLDPAPIAEAAAKVLALVDQLAAEGIVLEHIDLGGGLGIRYHDETPPAVAEYLAPLLRLLDGRREQICFEPGRSLIGNAGVLLTRIEYLKPGAERNFAVVDAAMNDLARPALYDAWHEVVAVTPRDVAPQRYEIVGPVCESGDFLAHDRSLAVAPGDLLAVLSAGAYGMTMSSNYNTRARAAEVMVSGDKVQLVRARESIESLYALESRLSEF